jgi:hypothetical protein
MGFQVSPGINVSEIDLSTVVPAVASTEGAIAGVFRWGPLNQRVLVNSEVSLATRFGKPIGNTTWSNAETFFTAADFLAYGNKLYVARVASAGAYNAGTSSAQISTAEQALANADAAFIGRYPGSLGNSLKVSICENAANFSSNSITSLSITVGSKQATGVTGYATLVAGDILRVGSAAIGYQDLVVATTPISDTVTFTTKYRLSTALSAATNVVKFWGAYKSVNLAPTAGNIHVVVIDEDGAVTGTEGLVIEVFENVSTIATRKTESGATNYYKELEPLLSTTISHLLAVVMVAANQL